MTSTFDAQPMPNFAGIQALRSREAGYAVARKCLEVQSAAEAVDPTLHTDNRTRLSDDAWSWYVGTIGEIWVGQILTQLGADWFVRHSVPIGAGTTDVDHLLIGPAGVFALNTKRHDNASIWVGDRVLRVNMKNTSHLEAAQSEAANVARRLGEKVGFPVSVTSVLVMVGEKSIKDIRNPATAHPNVVSSRVLIPWLLSRPISVSPAEFGLLRLAAEDPGTWHVDPTAADTLRVMPRFARLRGEVGDNPTMSSRPHAPAPVTERGPERRTAGSAGRTASTRRQYPSTARSSRGRKSKKTTAHVVGRLVTSAILIGGGFLLLHLLAAGHF